MSRLCYPYGAGISCTCSASKRILSCVPVMDSVAGQERFYDTEDVMAVAGQESDQETVEAGGGDERTEIILAATFLLIVILSFTA